MRSAVLPVTRVAGDGNIEPAPHSWGDHWAGESAAERQPRAWRDGLLGRAVRAIGGAAALLARALDRVTQLGTGRVELVDENKRTRLANLLALIGAGIMLPWLVIEALVGNPRILVLEAVLLLSFLVIPTLNALRANRAARLLLVCVANGCVLAGAAPFSPDAGGILPFVPLVALPLLLFGPAERRLLIVGALIPLGMLAASASGAVARWLALQNEPSMPWYFAANVGSAFLIAFLIPLSFYRGNVRAEAVLRRLGAQKVRRVIDSNLVGVAMGRLSGRVEEANPAFLDLLGYGPDDVARGLIDLKTVAPVDPLDIGCTRALGELTQLGSTSVYERTLVRKDGATVPAMVGTAFLDDSQEEIVTFVLDLTAHKRVEAQKAMLRESEEALRLRDLFSSIASHELKTPLAILIIGLQGLARRLAQEVPDSAIVKTQLERCQNAANRMRGLVDTLLDLAQIHKSRLMELHVQEIDVVQAVRRVVAGFEALHTDEKAPPIRVDAQETVAAEVDPLRFDQVVTNLVSNATKYAGGGPIELHIERDVARDMLRLSVTDHGPGIDPAVQARIFEPFRRGASPDKPVAGLGLGLYVTKMIVESHGGRIHVTSAPGEGARFTVEFPCTAVPRCPDGASHPCDY